jgi:hypothetical protein
MATATSKPSIVDGTIYTTTVTSNPDGSLSTVQTSGDRIVRTLETTQNPDGTFSTTTNIVDATSAEQLALQDPNSSLRLASTSMVKDAQSQIEGSTTDPQQNQAYGQAGGGSGNTAVSTSSPDAQSGSTPTADTSKPQTTATGAGAVFVYPIKMRETQQDRLKFTAVEYQPSGNLNAGTFGQQNRTSTQGKNIIGTVFLPIQASISDFNSVEWQSANINEVEKQAVNLSLGAMNAGGVDDLTKVLTENMDKALKGVSGANKEIKVAAAGAAVGINNLLGRFGTVLNPNLELLFSGPQLRPFEFKFQMSAREKEEGENIKAIINFFKKNMAVKKSDGAGIFLKAPNTFLIEYKYNGSDTTHPGINLIKECALLSCSVEYTPLGTFMTYPDGTMVSYSMSLSFSELEPIYSTDYDSHPIGY